VEVVEEVEILVGSLVHLVVLVEVEVKVIQVIHFTHQLDQVVV
jgi:hypothetical protein